VYRSPESVWTTRRSVHFLLYGDSKPETVASAYTECATADHSINTAAVLLFLVEILGSNYDVTETYHP
jgi:hypothetical protein